VSYQGQLKDNSGKDEQPAKKPFLCNLFCK
jgi:hypothetical protein